MIVARQLCEDAIVVTSSATALVFAGWLSLGVRPLSPMLAYMWVLAQGQAAFLPSPNESLIEFALRQSGAFAILLVVLWFYRRDWKHLDGSREQQIKVLEGHNATLVTLVKENTQAGSKLADALRENNIIVHQAKNILREYVPIERRASIDRRTE